MQQQTIELVDLVIKGLAVLGALAFFVYKVFAGGLAATMSVSLTVTPLKHDNNVLGLVLVNLERGEHWSVIIQRAELAIVSDGERSDPIPIAYKHHSRTSRHPHPREKTQYGIIIDLPHNKPVVVEVLFVVQQQFLLSMSQYAFASVAVPPVSCSDKSVS